MKPPGRVDDPGGCLERRGPTHRGGDPSNPPRLRRGRKYGGLLPARRDLAAVDGGDLDRPDGGHPHDDADQGREVAGQEGAVRLPRMVRTPIAVVLDFDKLDGGTFVLQLGSQSPTGTVAVNVAPDRNRGDISTEVTQFPIIDGKRGKATNLLTRRFEAGAVSESGFTLPAGHALADDRFLLEFGLHGEEPVTIRRLEVEAKIPATFGLSLGPDKGGVTVKSALKGGAGEKAGFKAGDILVSMDGEKLADLKGVMSRLADAPIGQEIKFIIRRAGQEKTIVAKGE